MLDNFGNPEMLGKQSGKRPLRPNSDLWKQLFERAASYFRGARNENVR